MNVLEGKSRIVEELVQRAIDEGVNPERILTDVSVLSFIVFLDIFICVSASDAICAECVTQIT